MGHSFGDKFLLEVAIKLLSFTDDNCELYRLGGDEFIFYIKNIKSKGHLEDYTNKIIKGFSEPFNIDGNAISTSVSIGISLFPDNGRDVDSLLKCADMAMYKVKERGKNGFCYYSSILNDEIQARVNIEKYLKKALDNNEFILYYQPQVDVKTKKIEAFEALIRWQSPELGMVSPLDFINVAEEIGFIVPLGEWILRTSCEFIKTINTNKSASYKISVNISVMQLLQDNFTEMVETVLEITGLSPSLLELEITESIIMESPDLIVEKLKTLREKGISIALDDFGTGYSSLAYLRKIPITTLKIDKLFIDDISSAECNTALTDSIIDLGHKIGLTIVAEGVETSHQLEYLESNKCDMIQGYLFSKPLPPVEVEKVL
jgi:predicted signal transduction protein with EAL and GGDEF domain